MTDQLWVDVRAQLWDQLCDQMKAQPQEVANATIKLVWDAHRMGYKDALADRGLE